MTEHTGNLKDWGGGVLFSSVSQKEYAHTKLIFYSLINHTLEFLEQHEELNPGDRLDIRIWRTPDGSN